MKQQYKKFSDDRHNEDEEEKLYQQPEDPQKLPPSQKPASQDMRFVVKESFNLGQRFITELDMMLRKLQE